MKNPFSSLWPAFGPRRGGPLFNLNDPRWGRGDEPPADQGDDGRAGDPQRPADLPPRPPRGNGPEQGPPDLDELWHDFNRKLSGLFGGGNGRRPGPGGAGGLRPGGRGAGAGVSLIAGVAALVWLASGFFIVQEGQQAVITQFGKYHATIDTAGLKWRLPYPIQAQETVAVTQIRSVEVGGDLIVKATGLRESAMLTADENIVEVKFVVQYRLNDARAWLFASVDPSLSVKQVAESAVREVVGSMQMDSALAEERDQIAPRVRELMQKILDRYHIGVEVIAINMQQGGVLPPEQVQAAFDDVLKATQERERAKNQAQAYANDLVPRANGAAARLKAEAEGYKARIVAQAQGDAQRFNAVLPEYQKAPQVTRERMYLDTMQGIYASVNKVIVDSRAGGNLMYLPLDKLMQAAPGATAPVVSAPAPAAAPAQAAPAVRVDDPRSRERESR